jgi:hypothetical protein
VRELRPVPPPVERQGVDQRRPAPVPPERLPPDERASAPHVRGDAARSLASAPREARDASSGVPRKPAGAGETLTRFEPRRAGLPEVGGDEAARYVEANRGDRPWLDSARHAPHDVQRVFAAADRGGGHAHIRHEGWLSAEKSQMRVQYLEDPAQLDPAKRAEGKDGFLPGSKPHYCAEMSTCIRDPIAFAVAYARGTEHPGVRKALETPLMRAQQPPLRVGVPITDLLGPDGHHFCEGYRLAGDDPKQAVKDRQTWLRENRNCDSPSVPPPLVASVDFRGGTIQFRFKVNMDRTGYEIATMFPDPPSRKPDHP